MRIFFWLIVAAMASSNAAQAMPPASPRTILEAAVAAAGGDTWLAPTSLVLEGTADFYAPDQAHPVTHADEYRLWRAMNRDRSVAHSADGKVRIVAREGGRTIFAIGFDGATTWNEKGIVPKAQADAYWSEHFGFGIIRHALNDGFKLESAPTRNVDGHALDMIRVIDPTGQLTLFGIDRESRFIRYMGFATPKGWHERTYDDFVMVENPRWLQAREVTLYYNGVRANTVHWRTARVNGPVPEELFAPPAEFTAKDKP